MTYDFSSNNKEDDKDDKDDIEKQLGACNTSNNNST